MSSERKILANRRNARFSTGPRTWAGKKRTSKNAWRHGLAAGIPWEPERLAELEQLANALAPEGLPDQIDGARMIAEAELDLLRVRAARANLVHLEEMALRRSDASTMDQDKRVNEELLPSSLEQQARA